MGIPTDRKINVLIFPAGAENALEIYYSLRFNIHLNVYGASGKPDHARFIYPSDHYIEGDYYVTSPSFIKEFNALLEQYSIDIVIPTHDTISLFMAENREAFRAKVIAPDRRTALVCREKKLTYELFAQYEFCPRVYPQAEAIDEYPVFLKPSRGEGSKGTSVAQSLEEVTTRTAANPDLLICEYLPGRELTVDCFSDRRHELLFIGPRTRERVQMGISFHSESVDLTEEIKGIAHSITKELAFRGPWFFQLKGDKEGRYKLLEISARQAGTMALYRQAGINFALLSIFDALDMDVTILNNRRKIAIDRCIHNRYSMEYEFQHVYIDFDDTIIVDGKVNDLVMQFLYQAVNHGKTIHLITKHELDIHATLQLFRISPFLFDEIIRLSPEENKCDQIRPEAAIFIDNHFPERKKVSETLGIPVYDVDAVESLIQ